MADAVPTPSPAAPTPPARVPPTVTSNPPLEDRGLSDREAQARIEDLFKKRSGGERGEDGKYKKAQQDAQEPAQEPAKAPKVESPQDDPAEALEADFDAEPAGALDDAEPAPAPGAGEELAEEMDFEHNGKSYKIPKPLVEGAMRQADYSRKMEEVTTTRRELAAAQAAFEARQTAITELAPAIAQVQNTVQLIASMRASMPDPRNDPMGYIESDKQVRDLEVGLQQLRDAVAQRGTELAQREGAAKAELMQAGFQKVVRAIPKWSDQSFRNEVLQHALSVGFTPEELGNLTDPRTIVLLHDAYQLRRLRDSRAEVRKKITDAAPVVRPTGSTNQASDARSRAQDLVGRVKKTGKTQDAEAAVLALLRSSKTRR